MAEQRIDVLRDKLADTDSALQAYIKSTYSLRERVTELEAALNLLMYGVDCELDSEGRSVYRYHTKELAKARAALAKGKMSDKTESKTPHMVQRVRNLPEHNMGKVACLAYIDTLEARCSRLEDALRDINRDAWADDKHAKTLRQIARFTDKLLAEGGKK